MSIESGADLLMVGGQQRYTLRAVAVDGTSKDVHGTWSSGSNVATVVDGLVQGMAPGTGVIAAEYDGMRATRDVRVVPDYGGAWSGTFHIARCTESGMYVGLGCVDSQLAVPSYQIVVNAVQDRAAVTATVEAFGGLPVATAGAISMPGGLSLSGQSNLVVSDLPFEFEIADWTTMVTATGEMTGHFTLITRVTGVDGDYRLYCDILSLKKGTTTYPRKRSTTPRLRPSVSAR